MASWTLGSRRHLVANKTKTYKGIKILYLSLLALFLELGVLLGQHPNLQMRQLSTPFLKMMLLVLSAAPALQSGIVASQAQQPLQDADFASDWNPATPNAVQTISLAGGSFDIQSSHILHTVTGETADGATTYGTSVNGVYDFDDTANVLQFASFAPFAGFEGVALTIDNFVALDPTRVVLSFGMLGGSALGAFNTVTGLTNLSNVETFDRPDLVSYSYDGGTGTLIGPVPDADWAVFSNPSGDTSIALNIDAPVSDTFSIAVSYSAPVPEPSVATLSGLAAAALLLRRQRRRSR